MEIFTTASWRTRGIARASRPTATGRLRGVENEYADFIIAKLRPFLDVVTTDKTDLYRLYHDSFAQYLLDATRNQDYPIDAKKYHAQLAAYYFGKFDGGGEVAAGRWSPMRMRCAT